MKSNGAEFLPTIEIRDDKDGGVAVFAHDVADTSGINRVKVISFSSRDCEEFKRFLSTWVRVGGKVNGELTGR